MDTVWMKYRESIKSELMDRLYIYPKHMQIAPGRSERYRRNLTQKIKQAFGKQNHQLVTMR
jgi:hypothetical protein